MLGQALILGIALIVPQCHVYGGNSLDRLRCATKCLGVDFKDAELNQVLDCKDKKTESVMIDIAYDRVVISTVDVGTWPPRLTPLVTIWRKHPNYEKIVRLTRIEPMPWRRGLIPAKGTP